MDGTKQGMGYEIPNEMRDYAERSVEQARKAMDGFMTAATKAVDMMPATPGPMNTVTDMTRKAMTYAERNVAASFDLATKLVRAKDPQEMLRLQMEFAQSQMQTAQEQLRAFGSEVRSAAESATNAARS